MKTTLLIVCIAVASCGGTFTLSPIGGLSYTTPKLIQPPTILPSK